MHELEWKYAFFKKEQTEKLFLLHKLDCCIQNMKMSPVGLPVLCFLISSRA